MHLALGDDLFDSFQRYQHRLITEYDSLAHEFGFVAVDARRSVDDIQGELRQHIRDHLARVRSTANGARDDGAVPASRR
jgi:thymidylate kinase